MAERTVIAVDRAKPLPSPALLPDSLQRPSWSDPSHRLARHLCDAVEIGIIVQHRRARCFRCGRDDRVRDLHAPVVQAADMGEASVDLERSLEARGRDRDAPQGSQLLASAS